MNLKAAGTITGKGSAIKLNSPTNIKGTTLDRQMKALSRDDVVAASASGAALDGRFHHGR